MSDLRIDLPINKGLLDARSVGRTFAALRDRFYPVEFFDLCSIIEEMVLRDEVILVGKFESFPRYTEVRSSLSLARAYLKLRYHQSNWEA